MTTPNRGRVLISVAGNYDPEPWRERLCVTREVFTAPAGPVDPAVDYAVVWNHEPGVLSKLPNLKLIFSIGAGVDHIFADPDLPDVPVVRVVAQDLTQHMTEYVAWRVLDHHRQGMAYRKQQEGRLWHEPPQPPADAVAVGIMGLGQLGRACAATLRALGFRINGWSRRPREIEGVNTYSGADELDRFLAATDILVVLLPHTPETEGIIDHDLLGKLNRDNPLGGPVLINAGRGKLQKEADIMRALDDGTLKEASLDVFEEEPLSEASPLWAHPRVFVTPHAAAASNPDEIVPMMLEQMDRFERGDPLDNLVDRAAGY